MYEKVDDKYDQDDEDDEDKNIDESSLLLNDKDEDHSEYYNNYNNLEDVLIPNNSSTRNNLELKQEQENHFIYENQNDYEGFESIEEKESRMAVQILDYDMNYTIKQLEHILAYYDMQKKNE